MIAWYSLVKYIPAGSKGVEFLNVGVLGAVGDQPSEALFTEDWARAEQFGQHDVSYLRAFVEDVVRQRPTVTQVRQIVALQEGPVCMTTPQSIGQRAKVGKTLLALFEALVPQDDDRLLVPADLYAMGPDADEMQAMLGMTEADVLHIAMLAGGASPKQIGTALGLSRVHVNRHEATIALKLGSVNTHHTVSEAIHRGMIRRTPDGSWVAVGRGDLWSR